MFLSLKETGSTGTNFCFNAAILSRVLSSLNLGCTRERERQSSRILISGGSVLSLFSAFAGKGYFTFQFMWKYFIIFFFFIFSILFSEELPQDILSESGKACSNPSQKWAVLFTWLVLLREPPMLCSRFVACAVWVHLFILYSFKGNSGELFCFTATITRRRKKI